MMRDGLDDDLRKHGYVAHSVKKLCEEQEMKLRSDFSLMKYAQKHNMVVVTEDIDNVLGCEENNMDCVKFGQGDTLNYLLAELEKIKIKRDSESTVLIPKEKLHEGFEKCFEHVANLLSDSRKMHDDKRFVSSIALSILAFEEIGKLDFIRTYINKNTDITKEDWDEFSSYGSHSFKLLSFYQLALDDVKRLGKEGYDKVVEEEKKKGSPIKHKTYAEIINAEATLKTSLKKYNSIKKACFYLDWKEKDWFSITTFYSDHELNLLAVFLLDFVSYGLLTERLDYRYPLNLFHQVPDEISTMKKDTIWLEREEYVKKAYTEKYREFFATVNYLIDRFPK